MTREERLEAMAETPASSLVELADRVMATLEVEVTNGPTTGLMMVRAEEPSERLVFNFVEVTVTEAEVIADGKRGYAVVMGRSPEKALSAAVLDLAMEAAHPLASDIEAALSLADARARQDLLDRWSAVAPTQVRFEDVT